MHECLVALAVARNPHYGVCVLATGFFDVSAMPETIDAAKTKLLATSRKVMPPTFGVFAEL